VKVILEPFDLYESTKIGDNLLVFAPGWGRIYTKVTDVKDGIVTVDETYKLDMDKWIIDDIKRDMQMTVLAIIPL
jgi:hypothetical protein